MLQHTGHAGALRQMSLVEPDQRWSSDAELSVTAVIQSENVDIQRKAHAPVVMSHFSREHLGNNTEQKHPKATLDEKRGNEHKTTAA